MIPLGVCNFLPVNENGTKKTKGVCHTVALPFCIKKVSYGKRRYFIMKTQIFQHAKKYNLPKTPLKKTKILQIIITLYNYSQVLTQAKISSFEKSSYNNRTYYLGGKIP